MMVAEAHSAIQLGDPCLDPELARNSLLVPWAEPEPEDEKFVFDNNIDLIGLMSPRSVGSVVPAMKQSASGGKP
ncbi:hypothetical protein [Methylobacterium sp. J-070]|uniref:hypothetical protein n=1 Tax=Methylobacterium sp. J-070 TaxID=2836650 RepID=UPI001FB9409D|nr:hypothetical protein [Methylobacterium sp. J-070]MCJ2051365.1 hypothetical protein [Methylobacterium sp. J-070]